MYQAVLGYCKGSRPRRQETMRDAAAQTRLKLTEFMELCTQLQSRVLALETTKTNQALKIKSLKRRVEKLEKKASKRTHKLNRLYKIGVTLVDETQGRNDQDMFDTVVLDDEEVVVEKEVSTADPVTTAGKVVTAAGVKVSVDATTLTIYMDDITLAKALTALKSEKPMVKEPTVHVSAASTSPKVSAVSTTSTIISTKPPPKAKGIMKEPEETTIRTTTVPSQNHELAERLQAEEQGELTIKERLKLFVELMNERKNHFARLRAEEKRRKPSTKAQKRNQMCTYLKNMVAKGSKIRAEGSSKRARKELESDKSKKQKLDEKVEAEEDNDQDEAEMKMYMKIVSDDEIAIDAISLATKPPIIVDWKIIKEGIISSYHIIRANGSSKRYSSMIQML
uniref:Uncharacterized protein n=1 Tax=Tanacetum cinerariifolium TaxID=118510 RepID=A0A699J6B6_TANCI|nr:hypothetical protein [Tanacetum cinerariifolium]